MRVSLCLVLAFASSTEATILKENGRIAPTLKPESSKRFFDKDYPGDARPKVDVLHFKHPYPVVQDGGEFDSDFVKDENTDNGEWKAQTEYDRLRNKLARLKKDAAEALKKKLQEKKDIQEAELEYQKDMAKERADVDKKKSEVIEPIKPVKPEEPSKPTTPPVEPAKPMPETKQEPKAVQAPKKETESSSESSSWSWPKWSWPWGSPETPETPDVKVPKGPEVPKMPKESKPSPEPVDTDEAANAVEKAMKNLEECEKELADAKEKLKRLMGQLEQAEMKQAEAHEVVNEAVRKQGEAEKEEKELHAKYIKERSEHFEASEAYQKQKEKVAKLKADLEAAAAKVKAMRDAEDKSGGVYPTPESMAKSVSPSQTLVLLMAIVAARQLA